MSQSQPGSTVYRLSVAARCEDWGTFEDLCDADGADVVVQYGLFGKVVYG